MQESFLREYTYSVTVINDISAVWNAITTIAE